MRVRGFPASTVVRPKKKKKNGLDTILNNFPLFLLSPPIPLSSHRIFNWRYLEMARETVRKKKITASTPLQPHITTVTLWTWCPQCPALPFCCINHSQSSLQLHWAQVNYSTDHIPTAIQWQIYQLFPFSLSLFIQLRFHEPSLQYFD